MNILEQTDYAFRKYMQKYLNARISSFCVPINFRLQLGEARAELGELILQLLDVVRHVLELGGRF